MKWIYFCIIMGCTTMVWAQQPIKLTPITANMSQGEQPGFEVMIWQAQLKQVQGDWEKAIRAKSKSKPEMLNDELVIKGTVIPDVSADSLNLYTLFTESKEGLKMTVWAETPNGYITADDANAYLPLDKFLHAFATSEYKEAVEAEIKVEEGILKDLNKELSKLGKEHDKFLSAVSDNEVEINGIKNKISMNEGDQAAKRDAIQSQKKQVLKASEMSSEAKKAAGKEQKELEKELKQLVKEHKNYHKDIVKLEAGIRETEREVSNNKLARDLKQEEINKQTRKIQGLKEKLDNIE